MRKRLLYIHQYFMFPDISGGTRSYDLSKQFIKNGYDVTILTTSAKIRNYHNPLNKTWSLLEREGLKIWILNCDYNQKMTILRRIQSFFKFSIYTSIKITKIKADLVLATSTPLTTAIPALVKKFISKTPYIFEARDIWPEGPIQLGYVKNRLAIKALRFFEKFIYKHSSYIVVLSIGMKRCILERMGHVNRIEVIPNISEISRFNNISKQISLPSEVKDKKTVLYAGTMGPVNNIMYVAELAMRLHRLKENDIKFIILGDGSEKEAIKEYCYVNNILNKSIFFIDEIPKESLPYVYSKVSMGSSFVLDNKIKWDNSANKFFDTLAAGKPILINHKGWQADLIREENCGYVLPAHPNDEEVLLFSRYLRNDTLLKIQSVNAKRVGESLFSLKVATEKYLNVLNKSTQDGK